MTAALGLPEEQGHDRGVPRGCLSLPTRGPHSHVLYTHAGQGLSTVFEAGVEETALTRAWEKVRPPWTEHLGQVRVPWCEHLGQVKLA